MNEGSLLHRAYLLLKQWSSPLEALSNESLIEQTQALMRDIEAQVKVDLDFERHREEQLSHMREQMYEMQKQQQQMGRQRSEEHHRFLLEMLTHMGKK